MRIKNSYPEHDRNAVEAWQCGCIDCVIKQSKLEKTFGRFWEAEPTRNYKYKDAEGKEHSIDSYLVRGDS